MAHVRSGDDGSQETKTTETTPRTYSLLRPSAFSMPTTTTSAGELSHRDSEPSASTAGRFQLRPSTLDRYAASLFKDSSTSAMPLRSSSGFHLEPPKLCSPLSSRFADNNKSVTLTSCDDGGVATDVTVTSTTDNVSSSSDNTVHSSSEPSSEPQFIFGQELESRVMSVSTSTTVATASTGSSSNQSGFVFGSNLADRVVMTTPAASAVTAESSQPETGVVAVAHDDKSPPASSEHCDSSGEATSHPTLAESAALQQAKHSHVELKEVEVVTGEEDESNVFQLNVKLFVFDKRTQSWLERGLGLLRLNDRCLQSDSESFQSRLVMRVQGSLRVVLNTMIWPNMLVERSSKRSVRISAVDADDGIKIYLIQANPSDADQIYSAIYSRAQKLKSSTGAAATKPSSPMCKDALLSASSSVSSVSAREKRSSECVADNDSAVVEKRQRLDVEPRRDQLGDESNDSSVADPETEASNEGFSSSPPIPSSSSEA